MSRSLKVAAIALAVVIGAPMLAGAESKKTGLGREAHAQEIAAWDIDIRPDGQGLPEGRGSVKEGEEIFIAQCAACHGDFGEGVGRWPPLSGGIGTIASEHPDKTVGSFWPYASTVFDYVRRTMPFGNAQSLTADETYAVVAYLLNLNDVVKEDFELTKENFTSVKMPNADGFFDDDRETTEKAFWRTPCMTDCLPGAAKITGRARVLDVTPETEGAPRID